jgi:hypothetical protein
MPASYSPSSHRDVQLVDSVHGSVLGREGAYLLIQRDDATVSLPFLPEWTSQL